jgi:HEAT repeat protein
VFESWSLRRLKAKLEVCKRDEDRAALAAKVGQLGDAAALAWLLPHLTACNSLEARTAVFEAVRQIAGRTGTDLVTFLTRALIAGKRGADAAALALAHLGPQSLPHLIGVLRAQTDRRDHQKVDWVLKKIGRPAAPPLIALLAHGDWDVRSRAERLLRSIGVDEAMIVPLLRAAKRTPTPAGTRSPALALLATMGPEAVEPLVGFLVGADQADRLVALEALAAVTAKRYGAAEEAVYVRVVQRLGQPKVVGPLMEAVRGDPAALTSRAFLAAAAEIGDGRVRARVVARLLKLLRGPQLDVEQRRAAVAGLGALGAAHDLAALIEQLKGPRAEVRAAAAEAARDLLFRWLATGTWADGRRKQRPLPDRPITPSAETRRELAPLLDQLIPAVVAVLKENGLGAGNAAEVLWYTDRARALAALIGLLREEDAGARAVALQAVCHFLRQGDAGPPGEEMKGLLGQLVPLTVPALHARPHTEQRCTAAEVLGYTHSPDAVDPLVASLQQRFGPEGEESSLVQVHAEKALERLLDQIAPAVHHRDLRAVAALRKIDHSRFEPNPSAGPNCIYNAGTLYGHTIECARVRQQARQELLRRGEQA